MDVVHLKRFSKARLWPDGPTARLQRTRPRERSLSTDPRAGVGPASAAVEVLVPRGPVTEYAMLGATFLPSGSSSALRITVFEDEGSGPFAESLAGAPEVPVVGLPGEYVQAVLEGALFAAGDPDLRASGELTFDRGAFGLVGSNALVFRRLAGVVTRMLLGGVDGWEALLRDELDVT